MTEQKMTWKEWQAFIGTLLPEIVNQARSIVSNYMALDEDCEEIGSSDVSCELYELTNRCQTNGEFMDAMVQLRQEYEI